MATGITPWQKQALQDSHRPAKFLQSWFANWAIRVLNAVAGIRAGKGIVIVKAESGIVISWDPDSTGETKEVSTPSAGGGGGSISFQGEWDSGTDYSVNDIVIISDATSLLTGIKAGTFIAIDDVPAGNAPPQLPNVTNAYWDTLAKGAWHEWAMAVETSSSLHHVTVTLDPYNDVYGAGFGADRTIKFREIVVCDSGVEKKMLVLGSETYT